MVREGGRCFYDFMARNNAWTLVVSTKQVAQTIQLVRFLLQFWKGESSPLDLSPVLLYMQNTAYLYRRKIIALLSIRAANSIDF